MKAAYDEVKILPVNPLTNTQMVILPLTFTGTKEEVEAFLECIEYEKKINGGALQLEDLDVIEALKEKKQMEKMRDEATEEENVN